jgi:iron complex transport system ATP-binding protein
LGPNGAGKSTLLKLLSRELYPVAREGSSVRLFGQERWNVWDLRSRLGIVSHDLQSQYRRSALGFHVILSGLYSSIDVLPYQQFTPEDKQRADQLMELLGVADLKDRSFDTMSTGEQRRFLLGRALINDPDVLVLDEPTGGLDLKSCFQYLDIVRGLMRSGKTIILVTHHIHEIPPEVARVVLLKNGRVVGDGEKTKILTSESLSFLFDTSVQLVQVNGFYLAVPSATQV